MAFSSSGSFSWLTAAAALGGAGFMPVYMPSYEDRRAQEIRLRKEKSYEDLVKAAEERDGFNRNASSSEEAAPAARPKKRSRLKRAWDRVLIGLHLKKKSQPVAPELIQNREEESPRIGPHGGKPSQQDDLQSSPLIFRRDAQGQQGISPSERIAPFEDVLYWSSAMTGDDANSSEVSAPLLANNPTSKDKKPALVSWES